MALTGEEGSRGPVPAGGELRAPCLPPDPRTHRRCHSTIFLEKVDPHHFVIFCVHNRRHGKETVMVNLSECPLPGDRPRPQQGQGKLLPHQPAVDRRAPDLTTPPRRPSPAHSREH